MLKQSSRHPSIAVRSIQNPERKRLAELTPKLSIVCPSEPTESPAAAWKTAVASQQQNGHKKRQKSSDDFSGDYDPNNFYVHASDDRGHNDHVSGFNVPPHWMVRIAEAVESSELPAYRTRSDFLRDAIYHRLHYLAAHMDDPALLERLRGTLAIAEHEMLANNHERQQKYWRDSVDRVKRITSSYFRDEAWDALYDYVTEEAILIEDRVPEPYASHIGEILADARRRLPSHLR